MSLSTHDLGLSLATSGRVRPASPVPATAATTDPTHPGGTVLDQAQLTPGYLVSMAYVHTRWASPPPTGLKRSQPTYSVEVTKLFESGLFGVLPARFSNSVQTQFSLLEGVKRIWARVAYPALFYGLLCFPSGLAA